MSSHSEILRTAETFGWYINSHPANPERGPWMVLTKGDRTMRVFFDRAQPPRVLAAIDEATPARIEGGVRAIQEWLMK